MRTVATMAAAAAVGLLACAAPAAIVTFDSVIEYSGGQQPAGPQPWLRAVFNDNGGTGSVTLTLTALNLTGSEFVNDWFFNLDPALNPTNLNFAVQNTTGTFATPVVLKGTNAFNAAGSTDFDILVDFDNAPPANRFGPGESIQFLITGIPTLTANSFNFLSVPGGHGPFLNAAHVQGIGPNANGSGWVTVPEPTSLGATALGAAVLVRPRRRRSA
jgi:hypothetical protein